MYCILVMQYICVKVDAQFPTCYASSNNYWKNGIITNERIRDQVYSWCVGAPIKKSPYSGKKSKGNKTNLISVRSIGNNEITFGISAPEFATIKCNCRHVS